MQFQQTDGRKFLLRSLITIANKTNPRAAEQHCLSLLHHCESPSYLYQIHAHILKHGLQSNPLVLTKFASTSSKLNSIGYASSFLFSTGANTSIYDSFLFNTIIRSYAQAKELKYKAIQFYKLMVGYGILPNKFTYPFVLKACAGLGELKLGKQVHGSALRFGFDDDLHVQNTMVHMYGSCGEDGIEMARKVFNEMPKLDSVSWSAMIGAHVRMGYSSDAIDLFRQMQINGVQPDEITMVSVLSACTDLGALELGKWIQSYIEREKFNKSVEVCNALIDMFAKCGDVEKALRVFRSMSEDERRNTVSWTSVISGLAMHGRGSEAISLFEGMKGAGVVPDDVAFIGLFTACSHAGLVEEGRHYFDSMLKEYGMNPKMEHYGCMVDLFCRAGHVKEALQLVREMPVEPNPVIYRTLLSACRAQGELKLGESITKILIGNDPSHDSNYVLLSNIYAKMAQWEKKYNIREVMDRKGVKKTPGSTMVELGNEIYEFVAGDRMHDRYQKEIYEMLDEMGRKMKKAGYVATTTEVLLDVDEEDKQDALNTHSEKLAIAFVLLKTPPGTPIRIVKNLRVCSDCHVASKFISVIYNREIVVRDRSRFHHFKDGVCSCKDFW